MDAVAAAVASGALPGEVLVQYGHATRPPAGCRSVPFLSREEFREAVAAAGVVVAHAGAGSLGACLAAGKRPVAVPRLARFGEIVNDHQLELARALAAQGRIVPVYDVEELPEALRRAREDRLPAGWAAGGEAARSRVAALLREAEKGIR